MMGANNDRAMADSSLSTNNKVQLFGNSFSNIQKEKRALRLQELLTVDLNSLIKELAINHPAMLGTLDRVLEELSELRELFEEGQK